MGRYQRAATDSRPADPLDGSDDKLLELGIMCSSGRSAPTDLVSAHKWFNLAAMLGNKEAIRLRREIAGEMSQTEIAAAQRAARDWLTRH